MAAIPSPVRADLQAVDARCTAYLHAHGPVPSPFVRHLDRSPSRGLRSALLLLSARSCGYHGDLAIQYAAAVELIHRATLLHRAFTSADAPVHADTVAQRDLAVLLGDFLYVTAMRLALAPDRRDIVLLICEATIGTFEGGLYQLATTPGSAADDSEYLELITRQTAPLFAVSAEIGARLGNAGAAAERAFARYGFGFGMAFHLLDHRAIADAPARARQHAAEARRAIDSVDASEERDVLVALLDALDPPPPRHAPAMPRLGTSRV